MGASSPGDGEDDPSGSRFSDGAKRSARGAAGGDPVIDDDDRPARKRRRRLVAEINPPAPLDLTQLPRDFACNVAAGDGELAGHDCIDEHRPGAGDAAARRAGDRRFSSRRISLCP